MKKIFGMVILVGLVWGMMGVAGATPERADRTGKSCGECHSHVGKPLGK